MGRPKKTKLESLNQTHGKVETQQITSLDQLWGFNPLSKYQTLDEIEYLQRLKEMNRTDLEEHARANGSIIVESSERIRNELVKVFRAFVSSLNKPKDPPVGRMTLAAQKEAAKLLKDGR